MFTISNYSYDCLKNCRSRDHGETVARNVLHRKNASDEKLAAFIAKSCKNFAGIDFEVCGQIILSVIRKLKSF